MGYTLGPWKVKSKSFDGTDVTYFNVGSSEKTIAKVVNHGQHRSESREESEANASLIAAAPELLDALEKSYQQIIGLLNEGKFERDIELDASYIVRAITKAKGV